jgi:hypothetical protein
MSDHDRVFRYVERFFARTGKTQWPTVRQITRAFGWSQARLQDAIDGDPQERLFTSSYFATPEPPLAEHFVESFGNHTWEAVPRTQSPQRKEV